MEARLTLTITVGNHRWIHQSADIRLFNRTTGKPEDTPVGKLVTASVPGMLVSIVYSGFAGYAAFETPEWLTQLLIDRGLKNPSLDQLLETIHDEGTKAIAALPSVVGSDTREINFTVAALEQGIARLGLVSNRIHLSGARATNVASALWAEQTTLGSKPRVLITGRDRTVSRDDCMLLAVEVARNQDAQQVRRRLAEVNARAAARKSETLYISPGCLTYSCQSPQRGDGEPYGLDQGGVHPHAVFDGTDFTDQKLELLAQAVREGKLELGIPASARVDPKAFASRLKLLTWGSEDRSAQEDARQGEDPD